MKKPIRVRTSTSRRVLECELRTNIPDEVKIRTPDGIVAIPLKKLYSVSPSTAISVSLQFAGAVGSLGQVRASLQKSLTLAIRERDRVYGVLYDSIYSKYSHEGRATMKSVIEGVIFGKQEYIEADNRVIAQAEKLEVLDWILKALDKVGYVVGPLVKARVDGGTK